MYWKENIFLILHTSSYIIHKEANHSQEGTTFI